jgi:hypothetical protein
MTNPFDKSTDRYPIILYGSTGEAVVRWQTILGIPADGVFGHETDKATMAFQKANGLHQDGVVGHDTWDAAEPITAKESIHAKDPDFGAEQSATAQARGTAKPADLNAYKVAKRAGAGKYTEAEIQYTLAVARGEGYYGLGWKAGQGAGSHNWGAVQGQGPAGSFMHLDHHADGTPYHSPFKAYNSDEEGFLDMARILLKPNVRNILNGTGSLRDAVYAQHSNRYFELAPEKYLSAVVKNYGKLADAGVFKPVLSETGNSTSVLGLAVVGLFGLGGARYVYKRVKNRGKK